MELLHLERVHGPGISGQVFIHRGLRSHHLGNERDLAIYLPPCYGHELGRRYGVLYMQDGQNVFDARTSAFGTKWDVDGHAERLIAQGAIEPLIVVGIYNTPARMAEYTPAWQHGGEAGRIESYAAFLRDELKPLVDRSLRTLPGPEATGIAGASLGGLSALYIALRNAHVFGLAAAVSPSLWFGGGRLLREVDESPRLYGPRRLWLSAGTLEGRRPGSSFSFAIAGIRRLRELLEEKGFRVGHDLHVVEAAGGRHDEASWSQQTWPPAPEPRPALRAPRGVGYTLDAMPCWPGSPWAGSSWRSGKGRLAAVCPAAAGSASVGPAAAGPAGVSLGGLRWSKVSPRVPSRAYTSPSETCRPARNR